MTEKDKIYDRLCATLTNYETWEHDTYSSFDEVFDKAKEMYDLLVDIQRNWEEITTQE